MGRTRYVVIINWERGGQWMQTEVPQAVRVRLPEQSVETAEVDLLSNEAPYPERVPTRVSIANLEVEVAYDPSLHEGEGSIGELVGQSGFDYIQVTVSYYTGPAWEPLFEGYAEAINLGDTELTRRDTTRRTYVFQMKEKLT